MGRLTWRNVILTLVLGYTAFIALLAVYLRIAGDATSWGMLLVFAPRWLLLLPWIVLVPVAFLVSRWLVVAALAGTALTAFGVAGFEVPSVTGPRATRRALRLVTYNTDGFAPVASRVREAMREWRADVVVFQVCSPELADSLRVIGGEEVRIVREFCIVSALPIRAIDTMPSQPAGMPRTSAVRIEVETSNGPLTVFAVHFESPRNALWAARNLDFGQLQASIVRRTVDSRRAAQWVRSANTPFVVAGDFNLPEGSRILRQDWGALQNAFSERGWGFGYTMFAGKFAVRIDHVFVSPMLMTERIVLPRGFPSEHQPVVADIAWPSAR
jgi:vancomycin resistance protein VanJ